MLSEFMKQQSTTEGKKQLVEQAQFDWGIGSVQKKAYEDKRNEMIDIANEPFARTVDDPKLEKMRKEVIRESDPMAQYFAQKQEKVQADLDEQLDREERRNPTKTATITRRKPLYKGPTPAPNRFGIRPGYRWDAVDRSNASRFEHRVMTKMNEKASLKDDAYKWSVSDL